MWWTRFWLEKKMSAFDDNNGGDKRESTGKSMIAYGLDNFRCDSDDEEEKPIVQKQSGFKHTNFVSNLILRVETHYDLATPVSGGKACKCCRYKIVKLMEH